MQKVQAIGKGEIKGPRACHKTERETTIESGKSRRPRTPPPEGRASPEPVLDAMNKVTDENPRDHLDEDFTVPTTVNSGWTKRLKNLVQNAGVDRGNVEIIAVTMNLLIMKVSPVIPNVISKS